MKLDDLADRLEEGLLNLGRILFRRRAPKPPPPLPRTETLRQERERLLHELDESRARLVQEGAECDVYRQRLADRQAQAALLPSQIESSLRRGKPSQAFRQALELDRLRKEIQNDQDALPKLEQRCWCLGFRIRQIERRLNRRQPDRAAVAGMKQRTPGKRA
jgi:hypothetical protein